MTPPRRTRDAEISVTPASPDETTAALAIHATLLTTSGQFAEAVTAAEAALETAYTTALAARTTLLTATAQFTDAATTAETAFETTYTTAPGIAANVTITELQVGTP